MAMNNVCLIGRLVANPVVKRTSTDKSICTFSLGVPRNYIEQGKKYHRQDMIPCRIWGIRAERLARYVSKGDWVAVQGCLQVDPYEENGERKVFAYVSCERLDYIRANGANYSTGMPCKEYKGETDVGNTFDEYTDNHEVPVLDVNW